MPREIADLDAADYLAWKLREEMLGVGHVEPPSEQELSVRFRKIIIERPIKSTPEPSVAAEAGKGNSEAAWEIDSIIEQIMRLANDWPMSKSYTRLESQSIVSRLKKLKAAAAPKGQP